ncbi:MAG: helix-turn-helix domain-containing protein [Oscillospiraceae bacterium]|nr:helix-turn-helix domain-containing protein [Oscillospiraceae bacterium]
MIENNISTRIRTLRAKHGLTLEQIAQQVGVGRSTVRKWETGLIANMRRDKIAKLAAALHTTPGYLMGWDNDESISIADSSIPDNIIPLPTLNKIPLIGTIACGAPILAQEHIEDYVDMPAHIHADFALTCKGDSMINARIFDGDVVYIRQQDTVENGEIAAVLIDGEATLKRIRLFDDHISLEPENPQYRPLVFWGEEMNAIRILGKAVAFTSTVR